MAAFPQLPLFWLGAFVGFLMLKRLWFADFGPLLGPLSLSKEAPIFGSCPRSPPASCVALGYAGQDWLQNVRPNRAKRTMKSLTAAEIRSKYLEFFTGHGHSVMNSDLLVPANDPTLLFTGPA